MALSNRLQKEPASRALAARFVLLKVVTEDRATWTEWSRKYRAEGNGIPMVFVVRADGKMLYGKSGAPKALPQFLAAALRSSGRIPSRTELARYSRDIKSVQEAVKEGDIERATAFLARSKTEGVFAKAAIELRKLEAKLIERGKAELAEAEKKSKDPKTQFDGLLALVAVERNYKRLAAVSKPLAAVLREIRKDKPRRDALALAKLVDRAEQYEADKRTRQAIAAWKRVLKKSPDSPSGKRAAERIAALEKAGVKP